MNIRNGLDRNISRLIDAFSRLGVSTLTPGVTTRELMPLEPGRQGVTLGGGRGSKTLAATRGHDPAGGFSVCRLRPNGVGGMNHER